ncbi:hypothetical protein GOP47_0005448 [Adiantum capillus-veneris]|uniref:Uncharacterized protein n=1 Tax=Adiantum capillus-veneris TaxID=13818 RepID=A0A9D4V5K3_ADICA|nr:hypothetical protein GOP47_0005448 [Adiantum capillus-veneris]
MGEKGVAIEFTNRQVHNTPLNVEYIGTWLENIQKVEKSSITQAKSKAKLPLMPYLGAMLALTRIVYCALDRMDLLPPPWDVSVNAQIESKSLVPPVKFSDKECLRKHIEERKRKREVAKLHCILLPLKKTRSMKPMTPILDVPNEEGETKDDDGGNDEDFMPPE